ncbi:MAG: hypothetical protein GXN98_00620 [Euryarchaeota archaeon]|nr:hypothetical protein [Euryarchaeota archaeon]
MAVKYAEGVHMKDNPTPEEDFTLRQIHTARKMVESGMKEKPSLWERIKMRLGIKKS